MNSKFVNNTALITGITGQDGAYLSRFLLNKGYRVVGLVRSIAGTSLSRLRILNILADVELLECDLNDLSQVIHIIRNVNPAEIYNLAAQSSVGLSFQQPIGTINTNVGSVLNILEAIRLINTSIRFYQASSSEMFGKVENLPITEESIVHPLSPYAISKITGHYLTINYKESYGIFACSGVLFNHESFLRSENFFVKKVIRSALEISQGKMDTAEFGNLDIKRDFGWSPRYVEAMWLMLQQDQPLDYVICSGRSVRLFDIVQYVFKQIQVDMDRVIINDNLFRPSEIADIFGSNEKARNILGWNYDMDFFYVLDLIIQEEVHGMALY
jgi:GDPmannose 4,6-dehydratase